jgi:hypothetical protein
LESPAEAIMLVLKSGIIGCLDINIFFIKITINHGYAYIFSNRGNILILKQYQLHIATATICVKCFMFWIS